MISNDLLSEVLGFGVYQSIRKDERAYNDIKLNIINTELLYDYINIYELAHKCKAWALRKNYILASESNTYGGICNMSISSMDVDVFYNIQSTTRANTEVEAVIKACEWILNNKDRK